VQKYGTAGQAIDDNIIRRMRFAGWVTKATDTHSEYVILIAFTLQQWSRERTSLLRYTYIVSVAVFTNREAKIKRHTRIDIATHTLRIKILKITSINLRLSLFSRHLIPALNLSDITSTIRTVAMFLFHILPVS
jgi:hypothetical protein